MTYSFSSFNTLEAYLNPSTVKQFLASQLVAGRLTLVLGAGVSKAYGLPNWDELTNELVKISTLNINATLTNEEKAEIVLSKYCKNDDIKFAGMVRDILYKSCEPTLEFFKKNDLLNSLGALGIPSKRGHVINIVTFNFDDLLETYLKCLGFVVESIYDVPFWFSNSDVNVYHPHGLLPINKAIELKRGIVFATIHFDKVVGQTKNTWRQSIINILSSTTCVFIGLSGVDPNLMSILAEVKENHISNKSHHKYWGFRFEKSTDQRKDIWESRGIFQENINDYSEIPSFLYEICQIAASLYMKSK